MTNPFRNNVALLLNFNVPFRTVIGLMKKEIQRDNFRIVSL